MNKTLKVVFADDNKDFCEIISDYFSVVQDIEIVGIARDGSQAYDMIIKNEPDIAVLDIIMPRVDGLGVLEKLNENPPDKIPQIFILSALGHENITKKAMSLGAQYYFIKPFNLEVLADRIRQLSSNNDVPGKEAPAYRDINSYGGGNQTESDRIEKNITRVINQIGVPANIKGFQFLRDAIILAIKDVEAINSLTKIIYPSVAKLHNTNPASVERSIRHAIEVAWHRGQSDTKNRLFNAIKNASKERPTNSEFIATIADKIRLEMNNE